MMKNKLLALKDKFDVFLFDMFGVMWDGKKPVDAMLEAAEELRAMGKKVIVLSNAHETNKVMEKVYDRRGIFQGKHYDETVTAGDLLREMFTNDENKLSFYQLGQPNEGLFEGTGFTEVSNPKDADFIYISTPSVFENGKWQLQFNTDRFEDELKRLKDMDKTLICCNPDMICFVREYDEPVIMCGSIAQRYIEMGGEVEFVGKPYPEFFDYGLKDYDGEDDRVLMIGDTLETDILGANSYGIKSALVPGGVVVYNMKQEGFSNLEEYCEEVGIMPDYFL